MVIYTSLIYEYEPKVHIFIYELRIRCKFSTSQIHWIEI